FFASGSTEALHLGDGHALNSDFRESILHLVELERLDDGLHLFHDDCLRSTGPSFRDYCSLMFRECFGFASKPKLGSRIVLCGNHPSGIPPNQPVGPPLRACSSVTRWARLFPFDCTKYFTVLGCFAPRTVAGSNGLMLKPIGGVVAPRN